MSALPSLLVSVCLLFLPESPKFLLSKGREGESLTVLRMMFSSNTGAHRSQYPVTRLLSQRVSPHIIPSTQLGWNQALQECRDKARQLFSSNIISVTLTMIAINFAIQFGYYGLWLWFPELFNKLEKFYAMEPNKTLSVCEVSRDSQSEGLTVPDVFQVVSLEVKLDAANNQTSSHCSSSIPDNQVFINSFIISLSAAPTNIWTIFHMDKLGRKFFLCFSMLLSGASAFLIYLVNSATMNLILSCIFGAVSTMGFNSLDCLGIELFPTSLRSTAMAVTLVSARLGAIVGNLVFGYLVESHCATPILMVATLLIGGGLLGTLLPNTTKKPLM